MKVLVAGWFSFEEMGASAGDLMARDVACRWLEEAGRAYDVALASPFEGGVDWREVDPSDYSDLLFVCGPAGNGEPLTDLLSRFEGARLLGLNLTMLDPLEEWNPFHVLLERDSSRATRPDLAFLGDLPHVPVVGLIQIDAQPEYGDRGRHTEVDQAIERLLAERKVATVRIDTRLDTSTNHLRSPEEVESLIARMDLTVTTRLHGLVLSLKNGVPVVAIDSVAGGAKVVRQAGVVGWPVVLRTGEFDDAELSRAFDYCLTEEARALARSCAAKAAETAMETRLQLLSGLSEG